MKIEKVCKNCQKAFKRGPFDLRKYGNYYCPFECLNAKRTTYKRADETCQDFVGKEKK